MLDLTFSKKIELFRNMGVLSTQDYALITELRNIRNNLFHAGGLFPADLTDDKKEKIMEIGEKATEIMEKLSILRRTTR